MIDSNISEIQDTFNSTCKGTSLGHNVPRGYFHEQVRSE